MRARKRWPIAALWAMLAVQATGRGRLAPEGAWSTQQLLPRLPSRLQARALRTNRARYIAAALRRSRAIAHERAAYLVEFFRTRPCSDCDETDPLVLEFDHLRDKSFNIANGLRDHSWQAVLDEIDKCDVVGANGQR